MAMHFGGNRNQGRLHFWEGGGVIGNDYIAIILYVKNTLKGNSLQQIISVKEFWQFGK